MGVHAVNAPRLQFGATASCHGQTILQLCPILPNFAGGNCLSPLEIWADPSGVSHGHARRNSAARMASVAALLLQRCLGNDACDRNRPDSQLVVSDGGTAAFDATGRRVRQFWRHAAVAAATSSAVLDAYWPSQQSMSLESFVEG